MLIIVFIKLYCVISVILYLQTKTDVSLLGYAIGTALVSEPLKYISEKRMIECLFKKFCNTFMVKPANMTVTDINHKTVTPKFSFTAFEALLKDTIFLIVPNICRKIFLFVSIALMFQGIGFLASLC